MSTRSSLKAAGQATGYGTIGAQAGSSRSSTLAFGRTVPLTTVPIAADAETGGRKHVVIATPPRTFDDSDKTIQGQFYETLQPFWLKALLITVPIALFGELVEASPAILFVASFLGLIPLAGLLGDFTEDLCLRTNPVIGALINVTFGNATELIICVFALKAGYFELIKMSLLGSILGNMLLVLGTSFFVGGIAKKMLVFNTDAANTYLPLLMLSVFSFVIPSGYSATVHSNTKPQEVQAASLSVSRIVAAIACIVYICYMYFQLFTHHDVFDEEPAAEGKESEIAPVEEEEPEEPKFTLYFALIGMIVVSVLISFLSDVLVSSVDPAAKAMHLSKGFIGVILVPIVGNAAEHATAIIMAYKGKVDIALGVALGSSIQISLFMMPFLVVLGWIFGVGLDMVFDPFPIAILFVSLLVASQVSSDGRSNWLEGIMLMSCYIMISVLYYSGDVGIETA